MESSSRLRKALFLYLAGALLVLVLSLVLTISLTLFSQLKKAEDRNILHAAQTHAMTIAEWCRRAKDLAWQITSRSRIRQELEKFNRGEISLEEVKAFTEPKLQDAMDLSEDVVGILRLDADHRIVAACGHGSDLPIADRAVNDYISVDIDLLDPLAVDGRWFIVVSAPIRNRDGARQGTDLVVLNTDRLKTIVSNSRPKKRTGTILIGYRSRDTIAYLFPMTRAPIGPPTLLNPANAIQTNVGKAIAGQTGIEHISNTLVAYTPVMESRWAVVLTQDEGELYGPLYRKMAFIGVLFLLIYLLIVFGFGCVMKPLAGRILLHADDLERKIEQKTAILEKEIDRRRQVENRLRDKERFLASVLDAIQDGICVLTPDLKIVRTNKAMQIWYAEHVPMEGKSCIEVFHTDHQSCTECPVLLSIKNRQLEMKEISLVQGGGDAGVFEVYAFPMLDDHGMVTGIVQYIRNITERKRSEQALADSEQRLANIIDFLPDPTWAIDNNGRVIEWNQALERLTGINKSDIIGKSDYAYAVPFWGAPRPVLIDRVLNGDRQLENQYLTLREYDGLAIESESFHDHMGREGRYLSGIAGRLYNSEGDVVGAIESVRDITAAKRLQKEHEQLIIELKEAVAQVRTLSGLLPMCAKCKKIRDDSGYWNQLETYILQHTDVDISHGLCPECMDEMYGGQAWYKKDRRKN